MPPLGEAAPRKPYRPTPEELSKRNERDRVSSELARKIASVVEPRQRKGIGAIILGPRPREDSPKAVYEVAGVKMMAWVEVRGRNDHLLLRAQEFKKGSTFEIEEPRIGVVKRKGEWDLAFLGTSTPANMSHEEMLVYLESCTDTVALIEDTIAAQNLETRKI